MDSKILFFATTIVVALSSILCVAVVSIMPDGMVVLAGHMLHTDTAGMVWSLTGTGIIVGLIAWSLSTGAVVRAIAVLYKRLANRTP